MALQCETTPVRIIMDTTRRCNLNCWYCHSTSGPNYKGPELSDDEVTNVFHSAEQLKVFDITMTGGETMLWSSLKHAFEESNRLAFPALQFITNATVVTKQRLEWLKQANVQRICVSLDGLEEVHTKNRGAGRYSATIRGIQELRQIVDNITVISVLDRTNADRWPELTQLLLEIGVKQHNLSAVCFAGDAINDYRGLTAEQFANIRGHVEALRQQLPDWFHLRFNDILVQGHNEKTIPMHIFVEGFKGWHVVIRPDGKVNGAVRAWGRTWRENETLGNIQDLSLADILNGRQAEFQALAQHRYSLEEEIQRKFHLNATDELIANDLANIHSVEEGTTPGMAEIARPQVATSAAVEQAGSPTKSYAGTALLAPAASGLLASLQKQISADPQRFRIRHEPNFGGLLFDRTTFDLTVLNPAETNQLSALLPSTNIAKFEAALL